MIAFAVLPVFGALIAAPAGPETGCPSARQVTDAMQARFPIALVMPDQLLPTRSDVLRSSLDFSSDGTVVLFSLTDVRGEAQLRRTLSAPGHGQTVADCLALADTLAAIVERYLGTIAYETTEPHMPGAPAPPTAVATPLAPTAPGSPAPPRALAVSAGLGWRMPGAAPSGQGEIEGRIEGAFDLTRTTPRLAVLLSVGASIPLESMLPIQGPMPGSPRTATLRRFPLRFGAQLELPAGAGWLEPAVEVGGDLLMVSSTANGQLPASQSVRFGTSLDAAIGYRLKVAGRFYIRPRAAFGLALKRYDIGVPGLTDPVFSTPRASASFGIDTGVLFQ